MSQTVPLWRFTVIGTDPLVVAERAGQYAFPCWRAARAELHGAAFVEVLAEIVGEVEEPKAEPVVVVKRARRRAARRMVGAERGSL